MIIDALQHSIESFLPYKANKQQQILLDSLAKFILSSTPDSLFLLRGYAGTGKTSIVSAIVKALTSIKQKTILMAPTGRAAKVLSGYSGKQAFTIHKQIYRQKSFSAEMQGFGISDNLNKNTIFIVDEASMISNSSDISGFGTGRLLDDLIEYVYAGEVCKMILMGDIAQLPPVGQKESPALSLEVLRGYGLHISHFTLTDVVRQSSDSGILYNATNLRHIMEQGEPYDLPKLEIAQFKDVIRVSGADLIDDISSSYDKAGIDESIIITRSNKRANSFNNGVRNQILYRECELEPGDMLLIVKNNYKWCQGIKEIDFIANGDIVEVKRVRNIQELYGLRFADVEIIFPDYDIEMEVKVILDTLHSETPALPQDINLRFFEEVYMDYSDIPLKRDRMKKIKEDPYFNALQIKYAYAVTCHKAQGGQWKNVFLDMGYINKDHLGLDFYRWLYTAFTRATEKIYLINIADEFTTDPQE